MKEDTHLAILDLSATEIATKVCAGELRAGDAVRGALQAFRSADSEKTGIVRWRASEDIERDIEEVSRSVSANIDLLLAGVPIVVKESDSVAGMDRSNGFLGAAIKDVADSIHVSRLRRAGAVILGKSNMSEGGVGLDTRNRRDGTTNHPFLEGHTPGGSSGGSAAAVASGVVPLGTGSDGGGSVRIPAAFCGLYGLKPSVGAVPMEDRAWGLMSNWGAMAQSPLDLAAYLSATAGPSPADQWSVMVGEVQERTGAEPTGPQRLRLMATPAVHGALLSDRVAEVFAEAINSIREAGAAVDEAETIVSRDCYEAFLCLARLPSAVNSTFAPQRMGSIYRGWLEAASSISAIDVAEALDLRDEAISRIETILEEYDLIVTPTVGIEPWHRDDVPSDVVRYLTTPIFNLSGHPALTIPWRPTIGLQIIGRYRTDLQLCSQAHELAKLGVRNQSDQTQ